MEVLGAEKLIVAHVDGKFPEFLEARMFTYSVHKSPPPVPNLSQTNPAPHFHILFLYAQLYPELQILSLLPKILKFSSPQLFVLNAPKIPSSFM
jgi:hypothetical protein